MHVPTRIAFILYPFSFILFCACSSSTGAPSSDGTVERERISVSGSIAEDTVWESGKEYFVTRDVTVEAGAALTIQPDVVVKFAHERADEYYGLTVEGTLIADGGDSTGTILFTSGAEEWARKPADWRGIEVEASSDSSSVIRYCHIQYANVGIKADGSSPRVSYCVVEQCADTGILFYKSDWGGVSWCEVRKNVYGIIFDQVEDGLIECVALDDNAEVGIECKTSSPTIRYALTTGGKVGIVCTWLAHPMIEHSEVVGHSSWGILIINEGSPKIEWNEIRENRVGIYVEHMRDNRPEVHRNNIQDNMIAIRMWSTLSKYKYRNLDATWNWWGATDAGSIAELIWDAHDELGEDQTSTGRVIFEPFAVAPLEEAGM